ncbi:MAG: DUF2238 domain-containing protein [Alphaproteobacteria bacterium]|jgi:hypothetical protein|nr:DUF2238 domain-containing protein [Alphaproteobacteria bacterium]
MNIKPSEWTVLGVTVGYIAVFSAIFLSSGNNEFLWYVITLLILVGLVALGQRTAKFPAVILWSLSLWGLIHMAGGGVPVADSVLYAHVVLPVYAAGEFVFLRYDQIVHFYGFGITAWVLWHLLQRNFPALHGTTSLLVFPVLGAMGLGAVNEIIEFIAVVVFPNTNVGGYVNTALDLVFNASGAIMAMVLIKLFIKPGK